MPLDRRVKVLGRSALFENLPADALAELASSTIVRRLKQGEILFSANDPSDGLYIVFSGAVRAFRVNLDGREQTIHTESAGGALAEVAAFDGGPYPSTTVAEEDSEVMFLAREDVYRFMRRYPEAALKALAIMGRKLRMVALMVEQLALMDFNQRLAKFLLDEAERNTQKLKDGATFSLRLSHSQIAARLGSVREVVTRGLQKFTQQGIIQVRGHSVTVLKIRKLLELAEDGSSAN